MHQEINQRDYYEGTHFIYPEPRIREIIDSIFNLNGNKPINYELLELRLIQKLDNPKIKSIDDISEIRKYTQEQYIGAANIVTDLRKFVYRVDKSGFVHPRNIKTT